MYRDAAGFVLKLEVYPGGAVKASSSEPDRLKACSSHLLKPHGFEWKAPFWEHPSGGQRVVDAMSRAAAQDGFKLEVEDKGGLTVLPVKSLSDLLGTGDLDDEPAEPPTSPRPRGTRPAGASCPPTQPRKTGSARPARTAAEGTPEEKRARPEPGSGSENGLRRSLAASLDANADALAGEPPLLPPCSASAPASTSTPAPAPAPPPAPAPAPAPPPAPVPASAPEADFEWCLPDDVLVASLTETEAAAILRPAVPAPPVSPPARQACSSYVRAPGRPACSYGLRCYRRNPSHWREFDHPDAHPFLTSSNAASAAAATT